MLEEIILLWNNHLLRHFAKQLAKIDVGMEPLIQKHSLKPTKTLLNSRAQASLQLAFRNNVETIRFYSSQTWGVGIYELMKSESREFPGFMTVYIHLLKHASPHLYFDNKSNNRLLHKDFPARMNKAQLVQYDGYISSRYNLYAPANYALDSLVIGAPDVLDAIDRLSMGADVEILGNQLYLIFPKTLLLHEKLEELMSNGEELARAIDDNLSRYRDERGVSVGQTVGYAGRRLIRR